MDERISLMIVAGEASGDAHAASLVRALRERAPEGTSFRLFGATAREMRAAGVESIVNSDDLSILGLAEIGRALPRFWRAYKALKRAARERKPDAVVLVDWPDFNLRLARALRREGVRVIYYISPQLWAWRSHRVRSIRRDVDLLLTILPFEKDWYDRRGVHHVEFVGHPLAGAVHADKSREEFCQSHGLAPERPLVALLPGSRHKELERILPAMLEAASLLSAKRPDVQFVIALAPARELHEAEAHTGHALKRGLTLPQTLRIVHGETREALGASDAAAIASGTATLEAALLGAPHVIVYKESLLNWHILGSLISTEHYGLPNLIAGERLATELIQNDLTGERLSEELLALLDKQRNREFRARLASATSRLGAGGASLRAADSILNAVRKWKSQ
ncbi:MAG TPA: lipid-A-disaccharide synthase [Pyrinomonadaceae bacterium]|nr:lipid-A-disaccharide synthase [Pyrinomonadaceae bacterium]